MRSDGYARWTDFQQRAVARDEMDQNRRVWAEPGLDSFMGSDPAKVPPTASRGGSELLDLQ